MKNEETPWVVGMIRWRVLEIIVNNRNDDLELFINDNMELMCGINNRNSNVEVMNTLIFFWPNMGQRKTR